MRAHYEGMFKNLVKERDAVQERESKLSEQYQRACKQLADKPAPQPWVLPTPVMAPTQTVTVAPTATQAACGVHPLFVRRL